MFSNCNFVVMSIALDLHASMQVCTVSDSYVIALKNITSVALAAGAATQCPILI